MNLILKLLASISIAFSKFLIWRYKLKIITVGGSVGKTSTKYALGDVINYKLPTIYQKGSYNEYFSVPFALFGLKYPANPKNIIAWLKTYLKMLSLSLYGYKYKVAILEIGTDKPGDIIKTTSWLKSDAAILTAVQQEHMQNFSDLNQVAEEEFDIFKNAKLKFASSDSVAKKFIKKYGPKDLQLYGFCNQDAKFEADDLSLEISLKTGEIKIQSQKPAEYLNQPLIIAAKIAEEVFNFSDQDIKNALSLIKYPPGRMNIFEGINSSTIIDDTYNASPEAYKEALNLIYVFDAKRRILVLGNMNEFGGRSAEAHKALAKEIKLNKNDIIITIGDDANQYLFAELQSLGFKNLFKFSDPWAVGEFLKQNIKPDDLIFLKGSQNGVYLEESIKFILKDSKDELKLCRQSDDWMKIKLKFKQKASD
jgi:UDP-N-acetylmuramoyl-tripeptide--D-alanyl-D-alanine ligase